MKAITPKVVKPGWPIIKSLATCAGLFPMGSLLFAILSQWAWFSMSTRNFIGSGQNSAHPLLDHDGQCVQQLHGVFAYLMHVHTACHVTHLYANGSYARDKCHAMILVSWIRGVIMQMKPMK